MVDGFDRQLFQQAWQACQTLELQGQYQLQTLPMTVPMHPPLLHVFESVESTNTTLWQMVDQGVAPGTAVLALQQQAGRGQRGRQWQSDLGGLYLSCYLTPNLRADQTQQLTLAIAWGIALVLRSLSIPVRLKWLNDLMLQGRKLGGILTETRSRGERVTQAIVGVGINWTNPVPEVGINLASVISSLSGHHRILNSLEALTAATLYGVTIGYEYGQQWGMENLMPRYREFLHQELAPDQQTTQPAQNNQELLTQPERPVTLNDLR